MNRALMNVCPLRILATILDEKISQQKLTGRMVYQLNKGY
jgi:hypothetical protein